ncbi:MULTISPECIES: DUF2149 domain-containing protein [Flammeovirga]|uniref:DUF2149 domain-containing protein n=1 Tax=Flammeovirga agarivorans TaxID=2726742 RepID=A0A7X8SJW7_9BACT|nr:MULTISPECIES: DUF2149 domain-containing protein [Flammeovirga]NLR91477.1 DUF2149 domain-containing protein [Flammeovirga agarivorans]
MRKRRFLTNGGEDEDPLSGMANLFDIAMVFALALMVALVSRFQMTEMLSSEDFTIVKNPGKENMEIIQKKGKKIEKYKSDKKAGASKGQGKKIGTAYQLENGEIIYIPED